MSKRWGSLSWHSFCVSGVSARVKYADNTDKCYVSALWPSGKNQTYLGSDLFEKMTDLNPRNSFVMFFFGEPPANTKAVWLCQVCRFWEHTFGINNNFGSRMQHPLAASTSWPWLPLLKAACQAASVVADWPSASIYVLSSCLFCVLNVKGCLAQNWTSWFGYRANIWY